MRLFKCIVGSKLYGAYTDKSDTNFLEVYVKTSRDLFDIDKPVPLTYEVAEYGRRLIDGDIECHETLWADFTKMQYLHAFFEYFRDQRRKLLTKEILQNWVYMAENLYYRSLKLGKLKLEDKTTLDFLTFIPSLSHYNFPRTLSKCVEDSGLDGKGPREPINIRTLYLYEKKFAPNIYGLYKSFHNIEGDPGLLDDNGNIIVHPETETMSVLKHNKGVIYYDEKGHKKYIRFKEMLETSGIINGYATKSMYQAFRIITMVLHALRYNELVPVSPTPTFLKAIRGGLTEVDVLISKFSTHQDEAYKLLALKDEKPVLNQILIKDIVNVIRDKYERDLAVAYQSR